MNPTTAIDLKRAVQRYGDDLYRLALLLNDNPSRAAHSLLVATRQLATTAGAASEPVLITALTAALPREAPAWRPQRTPAWARPGGQRAEQAQLLGALARLPRSARLALGLAMLRAYEPAQIAPLLGCDEHGVREQIRDALLKLALHIPASRAAILEQETNVPEECRPTRAALALADPRIHTDSTIRGHLALCSACRAAEQDWLRITSTVEAALRGALREVRLPAALADQLQEAAQPPLASGRQHWLASLRFRIMLVTLPVLALIAVLVWPRGTPPSSTGGSASGPSAAQAPAPLDLVRRAQAQLYAPPEGSGVWHSRYAIQWSFLDGSFALLHADEWLDTAGSRHRLQLVHHSGGGPYEYELANGTQSLWYAMGQSYANSVYTVEINDASLRNKFQVSAEQRDQLFQARLQSGAWGIAAQYLRQAATTDLHTWGRQRDADGRLLDLISFAGVSPLALPADAPTATTSRITVLLAIDEASGRLREVRELFGVAGAEQTTRTTWQVLSEEWIAGPDESNEIFDHQRAWNGVGEFVDRGAPADATLPLINGDNLAAPTLLLRLNRHETLMPTTPPAGTTSVMLLDQTPGDLGLGNGADILTLVYSGVGRQLAIRSLSFDTPITRLGPGESIVIDNNKALLTPLPAQGYLALLFRTGPSRQDSLVTQIRAQGYTRDELIAQLQRLGEPTLATIRAQAALFIERRPHDQAWQALIGALADPPQPPEGGARHFVEQVFKRHAQLPDHLPDPYHRPPYSGWPERYLQENWARGTVISGTVETAATTRDASGHIYARQYRSTALGWDYDAGSSRVSQFSSEGLTPGINEDQYTVLQMLDCDGAQLRIAPDGARSLVLIERDWRRASCQNPRYPSLWDVQTGQVDGRVDESPFFADLGEDELTTIIRLGIDGRPVRTEIWAGNPENGVLLESWERVSEEIISADRLPADTFSPQPPISDIRLVFPRSDAVQILDTSLPGGTDLDEAIRRARAPFFGFGQGPDQPRLVTIVLGNQPEQIQTLWWAIDNSVFNSALNAGYAIYSTYTTTQETGFQTIHFYQGAAKELRAYLRDTADWTDSAAVTLQVGGQTISGWQVIERNGGFPWLLFELDGTLIAIDKVTPDTLPLFEKLQRLDGAAPS